MGVERFDRPDIMMHFAFWRAGADVADRALRHAPPFVGDRAAAVMEVRRVLIVHREAQGLRFRRRI